MAEEGRRAEVGNGDAKIGKQLVFWRTLFQVVDVAYGK